MKHLQELKHEAQGAVRDVLSHLNRELAKHGCEILGVSVEVLDASSTSAEHMIIGGVRIDVRVREGDP